MAAAVGKMSAAKKLEMREMPQPYYHDDSICGSTFHGLATTVERFAVNNQVAQGLEQIDRCISARREEMAKRAYPDPAHNQAIEILIELRHKYYLLKNHATELLKRVVVRFKDTEFRFIVGIPRTIVNGESIINEFKLSDYGKGGRRRKTNKARKSKKQTRKSK